MKVKKERAIRYDYVLQDVNDEDVEIVSYPYLEKVFDENGNLLKEISYDNSGALQEHFVYRYDDRNRRIEAVNYYDEEEVVETLRYNYNDGEQPVEAFRIFADGSEDVISYIYDDEGRLLEKRTVNDEGEEEELEVWKFSNGIEVFYEKQEYSDPVFREVREHDADGRPVVVTLWERLDDRTMAHKIRYNSNGQKERIEKFNSDGRLVSIIEIPAFKNDEPVEIAETTTSGKKRTTFEYDGNGRVVLQQEYNEEGQLTNRIARRYNAEGFLVETEVNADRHGEGMNIRYRIEYEYEYH